MSELTKREQGDLKKLDRRRVKFAKQSIKYGEGIGALSGYNEKFDNALTEYEELFERQNKLGSAVAKLYLDDNFDSLEGDQKRATLENANHLLMVSEAVKLADKQDEFTAGKMQKAKNWMSEKTNNVIDRISFLSETRRESIKNKAAELGKTALSIAGIIYVASEESKLISVPLGAYLGYRRGKAWGGKFGSQFADDLRETEITDTQKGLLGKLRKGDEFKLDQDEIDSLSDLKERISFNPEEIKDGIEESVKSNRKKAIFLRIAGAAMGSMLASKADGWFDDGEAVSPDPQYDHLPSQDPDSTPTNMPTEEASPTNIDPSESYDLPDSSASPTEESASASPEPTIEEPKECTVDGVEVVEDRQNPGQYYKVGPGGAEPVPSSQVQCN